MAKVSKKKEAEPPGPQVCLSCKRTEGEEELRGSLFTSNGENGMIITFWMCESCAVPLGPQQGAIDIDDPTTRV